MLLKPLLKTVKISLKKRIKTWAMLCIQIEKQKSNSSILVLSFASLKTSTNHNNIFVGDWFKQKDLALCKLFGPS